MSALLIHALAAGILTFGSAQDTAAADAKPKPGTVVVRAKHVLTGLGEDLTGGSVVVVDGKIRAVGRGVEEPGGVKALDAEYVTPGLVDASFTAGSRYSNIEDAYEITPAFRALDAWDPAADDVERAFKGGTTTAFVAPGNLAVIGGLTGVSKLAPIGTPPALRADSALKFTFGEEPTFGNGTARGTGLPQSYRIRRPNTRPAVVLEMRVALYEAEKARRRGEAADEGRARMSEAIGGKLPVRMHASTATEIRSAFRVAKEFALQGVLEGAEEAHRCMPDLLASKMSVVLAPLPRDPVRAIAGNGRAIDLDDQDMYLNLLSLLTEAGIKTALCASGAAAEDGLASQMRYAVRYGASRELALRAVTSAAAEILGVADRVGSLKVGLDGDLVLWNGDPFELTSKPIAVVSDGIVYPTRAGR